ncbi:MAG TPA: hypothetical protein VF283_20525 [Bryobacteraceae bacterium]
MKHFSDPNLGRETVSADSIEIGDAVGVASRTGRIVLRVKTFFFRYRNYLILFFLQGLTIWMLYNWFQIIHRMVDYYMPLPIWDYWRVVEDFPQFKTLHLHFLWRQHNDHRIIFPELVFLLDMLLWHGRQFLPLLVSFLCYLFTWGTIAWAILSDSHLSRAIRATTVLLAGIVIGWQGSVSLLAWPFLLQWTLTEVAAILSFAWLSLAGTKKAATNSYLALAIAAAVVVNYSSGNGLLLWPILIAAGFLLQLRKRQRIALILCSIVSVGAYFVGYQFSNSLNISNFFRHPFYSIGFIGSYLSMPFGAIGAIKSPDFGVCIGLASLAAAIFLFISAARSGLLKDRPAIVLFGFYCFTLLTAIITAAGRMNPADPTFIAAKPPRYVTVPLVNWAVLISLCLWLAGKCRWRVASLITTLGFIFFIATGFSHLNWWVEGSTVDFANAQEAVLSLEDNLAVPRLMLKAFPDIGFLRRMLPVLQNDHLSIYYRPRSRWLGQPAARFSRILSTATPGSITKAFPVPSGMEVSGWAYDGGDTQQYRWIILANERGRIVGFGERFAAGIPDDPIVGKSGDPRLPVWIGFASARFKSDSYRAYLVLPGGLSPLSGSFQVPPFAAAFLDSLGASISGIRWKMDPSRSEDTIPHIMLKDSPPGPVHSTWDGSDGNTEQITSSVFTAPTGGCIILPVLHGPSVEGLAVNVWNVDGKRSIGTVPMRDSDQQWRFWRMQLDAGVTRLRITVDDYGRGWGQWVAIGEPSSCR